MEALNAKVNSKDEFVLDFIRCLKVHINKPVISAKEKDEIELSFNQILESALKKSNEDTSLKLVICQSCTKYSSILPVRDRNHNYLYYLVYDQHLNHINKVFNTLFFSDIDSGHDIWKLSYELFAEEAMISNKALLVTYYGLNKVALGSFEIVSEQASADLAFFYSIQEKYILAHEVGHWIFELSHNSEKRNLLNVSIDLNCLADEIKVILQEIYSAYSQSYTHPDYQSLIQEQKSIIDRETGIVEECVADAVAYAFIFSYVAEEYHSIPSRKLLAAQALFLEMMNLQMLAMHHMTISDESFENMTSIRLGFFRNYVGLYFENDRDSFSSMLEYSVNRYEKRITTPMLDCFSALEQREISLCNALVGFDGSYNGEQLVGLIDP